MQATDSTDLGRALHTLFDLPQILTQSDARPPWVRDAWLGSEDMQMMVARDRAGSTQGFFVAAWGGHNAQSHNHNDVGNCVVFVDGQPVFVDLGAPTYTAKTFSSRRYKFPPCSPPTTTSRPSTASNSPPAALCGAERQTHRLGRDHGTDPGHGRRMANRSRGRPPGCARSELERGREVRIVESVKLKGVQGETALHLDHAIEPAA